MDKEITGIAKAEDLSAKALADFDPMAQAITTWVTPDIKVGDWFRVLVVTTNDIETVATLVRQSPSAASSQEKMESGSTAPRRRRKAAGPSR